MENEAYSCYEYLYNRSSLFRDVGKKLSEDEYKELSSKRREEIFEYLRYVSRKIILENDYMETDDETS